MAVSTWLREQKRVYLGNASSVRDFRSQLRGTKAAVLWGVYLTALIGLALLAYAGIVSQGTQSIARVQTDLKGFYDTIRWTLEVAVLLVAPIIVSTSIQGEVSRKAMDLIASAPVTKKYYLVGKVISGFRTIVMMLFLSLPISAASIVLGGATWPEVLVSYWIIALHGLLCIVISLPIAVLGTKAVPVVFYSYLACACWFSLGSALVGIVAFSFFSAFEVPFYGMLFSVGLVGDMLAKTAIFGLQVPNWILATACVALVSKFFVLGAGSAMSRFRSKETFALRIQGLALLGLFSFVILSANLSPGSSATSTFDWPWKSILATAALLIVVPFFSCWSSIDERKCRAEGFFASSKALTAAPEGGLPFLFLLMGVVVLASFIELSLSGAPADDLRSYSLIWAFSFWLFYWSVGWISSAFNRHAVGMARRAQFALTFLAVLVPVPVLAYLEDATGTPTLGIHPLAPLFVENMDAVGILANTMTLVSMAVALAAVGEFRRRRDVLLDRRPLEALAD